MLAMYDTDRTAFIGRAALGAVFSDYMSLSHLDFHTGTGYAFLQGASGITFVNSGTEVDIRIANNDRIIITSTLISLLGNVKTTGPFTDGNGGYRQFFSFSGLAPGVTVQILPNSA